MKKKQRGDSNKQKIVAAAAGEKPRAIIKTVRDGETDVNGVLSTATAPVQLIVLQRRQGRAMLPLLPRIKI